MNDIFPIVGTEKSTYGAIVKLKGNLKLWRKNQGYEGLIPDGLAELETLSAISKVSSWIGSLENSPISFNNCSADGEQYKIKVEEFLKSKEGQYVLDYYGINGKLNDNNQSQLINLITDNIFEKTLTLKQLT